jgi:hypothetical protein
VELTQWPLHRTARLRHSLMACAPLLLRVVAVCPNFHHQPNNRGPSGFAAGDGVVGGGLFRPRPFFFSAFRACFCVSQTKKPLTKSPRAVKGQTKQGGGELPAGYPAHTTSRSIPNPAVAACLSVLPVPVALLPPDIVRRPLRSFLI